MKNQPVDENLNERTVLNQVLESLQKFDKDAQLRILRTVQTFLEIGSEEVGLPVMPKQPSGDRPSSHQVQSDEKYRESFSSHIEVSPKEFFRKKQPQTDVERMACLAFFLTHHRDTQFFKTLDLCKINTEAAQPKFSNAAKASSNALRGGYFAAGGKSDRQLSAAGEEFVAALPDREAAKLAMVNARPKRKKKIPSKSNSKSVKKKKKGN